MRFGWMDDLRMCISHCKAWRMRCYIVWGGLCWWFIYNSRHTKSAWLPQHSIGFGLSGTIICFSNRTMTQHTSRLCKGYLTKNESDVVLHQMTRPPQSPDLNHIEMVWDESDCRVKEKQPTSAQHMWELLRDWSWENAKSVQSCHQGKGWLLWRISNVKYITLFWLPHDSICVIS